MHRAGEVANKIVKSNSDFQLVKIYKSNSREYKINQIKNFIPEDKLKVYVKTNNFRNLVRRDDHIFNHPIYAVKTGETATTISLKVVTITHSPDEIKLNDQKVGKIKVSSYVKDGKQVDQYATNASWLLVIDKNDPNFTIQDVSNDPDEIKRLGGQANIEKIKKKLDNEWDKKPIYEYIDYFKKSVLQDIEKQDFNNQNKPKPEEE